MAPYTVRALDPFIVQLIREYAAVHRVSQAEVITFAISALEEEFGRNGYPTGWRIPKRNVNQPPRLPG